MASGTLWAMPALATMTSMRAVPVLDVGDDALGAPRVERTSSVWNSAVAARAPDLVGNRRAFLLEDVGDDRRGSRPWRRRWPVARPMPMPAPVMRTMALHHGLAHSITSPEFGPSVWPT